MKIFSNENYSVEMQRWFGVLIGFAAGFLCLAVFQALSGRDIQWASWFQAAGTVAAIIVAIISTQSERRGAARQIKAEAEVDILLQETVLLEFYRQSSVARTSINLAYDVQRGLSAGSDRYVHSIQQAILSVEQMVKTYQKINWKLFIIKDEKNIIHVRTVIGKLSHLEKRCAGRDYRADLFFDTMTRDAVVSLDLAFSQLVGWIFLGECH